MMQMNTVCSTSTPKEYFLPRHFLSWSYCFCCHCRQIHPQFLSWAQVRQATFLYDCQNYVSLIYYVWADFDCSGFLLGENLPSYYYFRNVEGWFLQLCHFSSWSYWVITFQVGFLELRPFIPCLQAKITSSNSSCPWPSSSSWQQQLKFSSL